MEAARDLGYSPSALARALVTRRTRIIGVIVGDVVDPYFAEITRGVEDVAGRAGYLTIVCNADRRPSVEREYLNVLRDYNAEGAVFAGSGLVSSDEALSESVGLARRQGMHVVALAPRSFEGSSVTVDNRAAAYDAVDYLASLGHRRIALVAGPVDLVSARQRLEGFLAALDAHSLAPGPLYEGDFSYAAGQAAALRMRGRGADPGRGRMRQRRDRDRCADGPARGGCRGAGRNLGDGHRRHAAGALPRADDRERAHLRARRERGEAASSRHAQRRDGSARTCSRTGWCRAPPAPLDELAARRRPVPSALKRGEEG